MASLNPDAVSVPARPARFYHNLTFQVLVAIAAGILLGHFYPGTAVQMQVLGDLFIKMIKMLIAPVVFLTVVTGIAAVGDVKKVGRLGGKTLIYFEVVTTAALAIGLVVVNLVRPGAAIDPATAAKADIARYVQGAKQMSPLDFLTGIVPDNLVAAFAKGDLLPVLFFAILFGLALSLLGPRGKPLVQFLDSVGQAMFGVVGLVMRAAPVGAFGAMAFTIGKFGVGSLVALGQLMACVYITAVLFIFLVLGGIMRFYGLSVWRFLRYIKDEILIVLGTSTSESALPRLVEKLERLGCSKAVVGLVIPTGYSFNLDGTSIYMSMAALFIAQAYHVDLSLAQQLSLLGVLIITSKGAAAFAGGGFITLAATLAATNVVPVEGLALLLGVDRFMSEARSIANLIGNGIATVVMARMEGEFDEAQALAAYREQFGEPALTRL